MNKSLIAALVLTTLIVGCGGGSGSDGNANIKGNENKIKETTIVYPSGLYITTIGNSDSADLKRRSDSSPEYMGIAFGYHNLSEQELYGNIVGIDEMGNQKFINVLGEYNPNNTQFPEELVLRYEIQSGWGSQRNAKDSSGTWWLGNWKQSLPSAQKAQIDAIAMNDITFRTTGNGFKLVAPRVHSSTADVLFQPIETNKLVDVVPTLPNTAWVHIKSYASSKTYNHYEFTEDGNGSLKLVASILDNGNKYCQTNPSGFSTQGDNQMMIFETTLSDSGSCANYLNLDLSNDDELRQFKPYQGEHGILIGFIAGTGATQMAIYHGGNYEEQNTIGGQVIETEEHQSIGGAGFFRQQL